MYIPIEYYLMTRVSHNNIYSTYLPTNKTHIDLIPFLYHLLFYLSISHIDEMKMDVLSISFSVLCKRFQMKCDLLQLGK
jgi:hypothetical protein